MTIGLQAENTLASSQYVVRVSACIPSSGVTEKVMKAARNPFKHGAFGTECRHPQSFERLDPFSFYL